MPWLPRPESWITVENSGHMKQINCLARENSHGGAGKSAPTVLVVDDEPLTLWSMAEVLGEGGYGVIVAADAASAIDAIAAADQAPDVIFLDLRLPDSTDLAALSVIRRRAPHAAVVLMTAHGSPELFREAHRRGAAAVMDKPFEMGDVGPLVKNLLAARGPDGPQRATSLY
jgi:DNA-binding NtrC family response regulator